MMVQRVTNTTMTRTLNADIQTNARKLVIAQQRIASGKELRRASDGPANVLRALDQRAELRRYAQYERNASDANAWIANTDSTLTTAVDRLERVRTLVLGAVNGSADQGARSAAATEIEGIREELVGLANSTYLGRPLFAGVVDVDAAYDASGVYQGDSGQVVRTVAPGASMQVNLTGDEVFGTYDSVDPANGNLFQVLDVLVADLRAGDVGAARAGLTRLDTAVDRISLAESEVGARGRQLEALGARNGDVSLELQAELAEVEDVDYAKALVDLQAQQFTYQASLSVTARIIQPSLLDFLR
jgi:flagellar hook-associated protein 3 FlgL